MGYTHYWDYKNPVIEMGQLMNEKVKIHRESSNYMERNNLLEKLPTHDSLVKRIIKQTEAFKKIKSDLEHVLSCIQKDKNFKLCGGFGEGEPRITDTEVWFNGDASEDLDHETFALELFETGNYRTVDETDKEGVYCFCKTNRKPYDFAVMISLMVIKHHLGSDFKISSDGCLEDGWNEAIQYYESYFKRKASKQLVSYLTKNVEVL
jgi:hypothetical protein